MKKIVVFTSIFAMSFLLGAGIVVFSPAPAQAAGVWYPCDFDDIYCTSIPCAGHYKAGGIFYCYPDFETEYCSGDWKLPVPCSHIM